MEVDGFWFTITWVELVLSEDDQTNPVLQKQLIFQTIEELFQEQTTYLRLRRTAQWH